MGRNIDALKARLFVRKSFVCGGHGARWPTHAEFTVPSGITIYFYVSDTESLQNSVGKEVDRILVGGVPPAFTQKVEAGQRCWNYHLFSSRAGGYLNLGMSSKANSHYITTDDKKDGIGLEDIVKLVVGNTPNADIHWSACRAIESGTDVFDWSKPDHSKVLAAIAKKLAP